MQPDFEAYLDIETTGLSPWYSEITVIGMHVFNGIDSKFTQLVGGDITAESVLEALEDIKVIYTYNGSRFDFPFIHCRLGLNLEMLFEHRDLMYQCWRNNLYGGLKYVEKQLGIQRKLIEVNGYKAVMLWWKYTNDYDEGALETLLEYNKEDVMNLMTLKEKLLQLDMSST